MNFFSKKNVIDTNNVKEFLTQNGINWNGTIIAAYHRNQPIFFHADNKTFNKLIKKPIRLVIKSEKYKGVDVVTVRISDEMFVLLGIDNYRNLNLSDEWIKYQELIKTQDLGSLERAL